ncbi:hypothetical protein LTR66_001093 [Elasticomyces elasticus]|nr:hypothetical protein LTR28_007719 [Elasticomyces elasticus]KAK4999961.1 hypothetical protein LTR66_001093 [Elasticomyces elasticus]
MAQMPRTYHEEDEMFLSDSDSGGVLLIAEQPAAQLMGAQLPQHLTPVQATEAENLLRRKQDQDFSREIFTPAQVTEVTNNLRDAHNQGRINLITKRFHENWHCTPEDAFPATLVPSPYFELEALPADGDNAAWMTSLSILAHNTKDLKEQSWATLRQIASIRLQLGQKPSGAVPQSGDIIAVSMGDLRIARNLRKIQKQAKNNPAIPLPDFEPYVVNEIHQRKSDSVKREVAKTESARKRAERKKRKRMLKKMSQVAGVRSKDRYEPPTNSQLHRTSWTKVWDNAKQATDALGEDAVFNQGPPVSFANLPFRLNKKSQGHAETFGMEKLSLRQSGNAGQLAQMGS